MEGSTPVLWTPPGPLNAFKPLSSKLPPKFSLFSGSLFSTIPAEMNSGGYPTSSRMPNLKQRSLWEEGIRISPSFKATFFRKRFLWKKTARPCCMEFSWSFYLLPFTSSTVASSLWLSRRHQLAAEPRTQWRWKELVWTWWDWGFTKGRNGKWKWSLHVAMRNCAKSLKEGVSISSSLWMRFINWKLGEKSKKGEKKDSRPKEQLAHDFPLWRGEDGPEVKRKVRVTGTGQSQGLRPQRQTHGWLLL